MSERSKEHASKACEGKLLREFESRFIRRIISFKLRFALEAFLFCRACSGWKHSVLPAQARSACVFIDAGRADWCISTQAQQQARNLRELSLVFGGFEVA